MKLTKSYLKKLIKEEFEKEETLEGFVRRLVLKGYTPDAIHHAVQGASYPGSKLDASEKEVKAAIAKAKADKVFEEFASNYKDLYREMEINRYEPEVRNMTIQDLKRRIENLMGKREDRKFQKLVQYAKENPPSSDDPDDMRYE